jgi:phenylacetate-CoA ligase
MLLDWASRAYGSAMVLRHIPGQRRVPYLPEEQIYQARDRRVRQIVRHAADTVPYYREWFRQQGVDPDEIRTAEDLQRLPLVTKADVRAQPERFISQSRWARNAVPLTSSGSTGQPLTVYHDRQSVLLASAFAQRFKDVLTRGFGLPWMFRSVALISPQSASEQAALSLQRMRWAPFRPARVRLSLLQPIEEVVAAINQYRPHVISGYGSYLEALFTTVTMRDMPMHRPRLVVYGAEAMSERGKRLIEDHCGIPVLSTYSSIEAVNLAFMCEERQGFHLNVDLVHVRVVGADGSSVPNGERGELVVSNLANRAMVLLNYRLSDIVVLSTERCPCRRSLPLLSSLEGRIQDVIYLADGRFLHPAQISEVFHRVLLQHHVLVQHQLIQHTFEHYELRLATADRATFDRIVPGCVAELRKLLGPSTTIEAFYYPERLPPGPGGKVRMVQSRVGRGQLP